MISQLALFFFLLLLCATNGLSRGLQVSRSKEVLGRYLHIGLGVVKLRVMVAPAVVLLLGDLSGLQLGGLFLPGTEHLVQPGGVLVLPNIDLQADLSVHLTDLEPIVILKGEQGVHQPYIGVYIRDRECMRRDIQHLSQSSCQVCLSKSVYEQIEKDLAAGAPVEEHRALYLERLKNKYMR